MAAAAPEGCAALGPVDLDRCLAVARQAAEAAGAEIRAGLGAHRRVVHQKYNAHDLVTATDLRCEEVIRAHVRAAFGAAHRFIGEESAEEGPGAGQLTAHPTWIVDPLDGTANFVHGLPQVTVSIGLAVGGAPVLGVVYHPPSGEMFTAVKSRGAFLNDQPIHVSGCAGVAAAAIATELAYDRTEAGIACMLRRLGNTLGAGVQAPRILGSTALGLAYVAAGRLDAFYFGPPCGPKAWDVTAGRVLVEEAGGRVTRLDGGAHDLFGEEVVATAGGALHEELVACVKPED